MPTLPRIFFAVLAAIVSLRSVHAAETNPALTLFYTNAALKWTEALPIGNGRLGAMIFAGAQREHLQLNEVTLWAGGPYDPNNTNALAALPEARQLVFEGKYDEAQKLIGEKMMANPMRQMPYQTMGDLFLDFPTGSEVEDYQRTLDLDAATATVSYTVKGVHFKREFFASAVDQVIVIRLSADAPGQVCFSANLTTPHSATVTASTNLLVMNGRNSEARGVKGALIFQTRLQVLNSGGISACGTNSISVSHADEVTLLIAAATSYKSYRDVSGKPAEIVKNQVLLAGLKPFSVLHANHLSDYQSLFRRVELSLGETEAMKLPTNQRIEKFAEGHDPQLATLYFQFARYLLISCSRPGGQAATLQGLWNDSVKPPWDSKYTININTEMNYWPAETGNLPECVEPLTRLVSDIAETGQRTAKIQYGARGWVAHHNTDLWRATAPIDGPQYGMWPMGGAWLCQNLWEHYLYSEDKNYLKQIYPAMKGAAQFFLDTLVEEPTKHWLVTNPSLSPENTHPESKTSICAGPTMDMQILRDLFANCMRAAEILGLDEKFRREVAASRARLAPNQIGAGGQLQEWLKDWDMLAKDIHHRHVSHLYGLYPSAQIDVNRTPELAAAAKKSLEIRGDQATGWATAWRINLWARLHEGDHAFSILEFLLSPARTYPDMFDAHPPFQIDGNFGGASGMMEMLLQSHNEEIQILPALPRAWPTGNVKGLRARGGFEVSITWKDGKLVTAQIKSLNGNPCRLRYGGTTKFVRINKGKTFQWDGQ